MSLTIRLQLLYWGLDSKSLFFLIFYFFKIFFIGEFYSDFRPLFDTYLGTPYLGKPLGHILTFEIFYSLFFICGCFFLFLRFFLEIFVSTKLLRKSFVHVGGLRPITEEYFYEKFSNWLL